MSGFVGFFGFEACSRCWYRVSTLNGVLSPVTQAQSISFINSTYLLNTSDFSRHTPNAYIVKLDHMLQHWYMQAKRPLKVF